MTVGNDDNDVNKYCEGCVCVCTAVRGTEKRTHDAAKNQIVIRIIVKLVQNIAKSSLCTIVCMLFSFSFLFFRNTIKRKQKKST